ncbi:MAG: hypothetical protein WC510_04320 [Candidatus Omnitrophota bacterium]
MLKRRSMLLILAVFAGIAVFVFSPRVFSNNAGTSSVYSTEPSTNIGAWYDEFWSASGFYRLEPHGGPNSFRYEYTTDAITGSDPATFTRGDADAQASVPRDLVVTEWKVSGHVHFSSGM